jgi:GntR family transcriptional regulator, rspAB operon transcriptional repressor
MYRIKYFLHMPIPSRDARRTADAVFLHLHSEIVQGRLAAGERVDLDAVAEELEVSRTPVREALLRLETEGLVERAPYRGAVVAGIDLSVATETTGVRIHLEGLAVRLAVPRLTDSTLAAMAACLDELEALEAGAEFTPIRWNELNDRFHGLIHAAAACPSLIRPLQRLNAQARRIRMHFDVRSGPASEDHRAILAACAAREPELAARTAQMHILRAHLRTFPTESVPDDSPLGMAAALAGIEVPREELRPHNTQTGGHDDGRT